MEDDAYRWSALLAERQAVIDGKAKSLLPISEDYLSWPTNQEVELRAAQFRREAALRPGMGGSKAAANKSPRLKHIRRGHFKGGSRVVTAEGPAPIFLEDPSTSSIPPPQEPSKASGAAIGSDIDARADAAPPPMVQLHMLREPTKPLNARATDDLPDLFHWQKEAFSSLTPPTRRDVDALRHWLVTQVDTLRNEYKEDASDEFASRILEAYGTAFHDIARQVSIQCADRGRLLLDIWLSQTSMFDWWIFKLHRQRQRAVSQTSFYHAQFDSVLGKLLVQGDLEEYMQGKEKQISDLKEQVAILTKELDEMKEDVIKQRAHAKQRTVEAMEMRDELALWLPNREYYGHSEVRAMVKKQLIKDVEIPESDEQFILVDMQRLLAGLCDAIPPAAVRFRSMVDATLRTKGLELPPNRVERNLQKQIDLQAELISSTEKEVEDLSSQLSSLRAENERVNFALVDATRRLQASMVKANDLRANIKSLEKELDDIREGQPEAFQAHLNKVHDNVRAVAYDAEDPPDNSRPGCLPDGIQSLLKTYCRKWRCPKDHTQPMPRLQLMHLIRIIYLSKIDDDLKCDDKGRTRRTLVAYLPSFFQNMFGNPTVAEQKLIAVVAASIRLQADSRFIAAFARFAGLTDPIPHVALDLYLQAYALTLAPPRPGYVTPVPTGSDWLLLLWVQDLSPLMLPGASDAVIDKLKNKLLEYSTDMAVPGESANMIGERKIERDMVLDAVSEMYNEYNTIVQKNIEATFDAHESDTQFEEMSYEVFAEIVRVFTDSIDATTIAEMHRECWSLDGMITNTLRENLVNVLMQRRVIVPRTLIAVVNLTAALDKSKRAVVEEFLKITPGILDKVSAEIQKLPQEHLSRRGDSMKKSVQENLRRLTGMVAGTGEGGSGESSQDANQALAIMREAECTLQAMSVIVAKAAENRFLTSPPTKGGK